MPPRTGEPPRRDVPGHIPAHAARPPAAGRRGAPAGPGGVRQLAPPGPGRASAGLHAWGAGGGGGRAEACAAGALRHSGAHPAGGTRVGGTRVGGTRARGRHPPRASRRQPVWDAERGTPVPRSPPPHAPHPTRSFRSEVRRGGLGPAGAGGRWPHRAALAGVGCWGAGWCAPPVKALECSRGRTEVVQSKYWLQMLVLVILVANARIRNGRY